MSSRLALNLFSSLLAALRSRGVAHLALSGGSAAILPLHALRLSKVSEDFSWLHVHIWLTDERCSEEERKNINTIRKNLIISIDIPSDHIHEMPCTYGKPDAEDIKNFMTDLTTIIPDQKFDFILLGVGSDGHTASLFPQQSELKSVAMITESYHSLLDEWRVTLTFPMINKARDIGVFISGSEKRRIVGMLRERLCEITECPIIGVEPSEGSVTWYIDDEALAQYKESE